MCLQFFEDHADLLNVFFESVGVNENVIEIDDGKEVEVFADCVISV